MSEMRVTLIANASQPVSEFGKLQAAATDSAKSFAQVTKAATEGAKAASGSFVDLKAKLASARAELDRLSEGTPEFEQQAASVKALSTQFNEAKNRIAELTAAENGLATGTARLKEQQAASTAAAGSVGKLKEELSAAESELNKLEIGSEAFKEQAAVVARLTGSLDSAKQQVKEMIAAESALGSGTAILKQQQSAAIGAAGSYATMKEELAAAESELNKLEVGSEAFREQAAVVGRLSASVETAKQQIKEMVAAESGLATGTAQLKEQQVAIVAATGSLTQLKQQLSAAETELNGLEVGSEAFKQQAIVVGQLSASVDAAKQQMKELVASESGLASGTAALAQQNQAVTAVAGSFAALEGKLKENVARLKEMEAGTPEFQEQAAVVRQLAAEFDAAKQQLSEITTVEKQLTEGTNALNDQSKAAKAAAGSFAQLDAELKENTDQLRNMKAGTAEFAAQKRKVDELRGSLEKAKTATSDGIQAQSGIGGIVDNFTSSLSGTVTTLVSVGAIAQSLKADLENIKKVNENKRLAEVDFGKAIASRSISNLAEPERVAVRPLALNLADELGLNAGGIVEAIGTLRSSGANDILEAANFLREASKAFPQDLAQATAIAQGALIEARATGNRNAQETVGGLVQSQAVSQVTDAVSFSKAFSANTAGAVAILKLSAEKAREEAAIFSVLEPKSAEVASESQKSFFRQLQQFQPEASKKLKTGGEATTTEAERKQFADATFEQRMRLVETNPNLQAQFIGGLQDSGRNAITQRVKQTQEDQGTFDTIRQGILGNADAAKELVKLQGEAAIAGAFAIAEGQRKASEETANLRADSRGKLEAELETIFSNVQERTRAFVGGSIVSATERFGARTEQLTTGSDRAQVLLDTVRFRAETATDPQDKAYLEQQVANLEALQQRMLLLNATNERGNQILEQMLQKMNGNQGGPAPRNVAPAVQAPPVPRRPIAQGAK